MADVAVPSEMTGIVREIVVHLGDLVDEGDTLLVMESMKMEIPLVAPDRGHVADIMVEVGQTVMGGDPCIVLRVDQ